MASQKFALNDVLSIPNSTVKIPRLGFGVYQTNGKQCVTACLLAFKAGYRHIDSAQLYGNEKEVGEAVRQCGLDRSDVFITTKIMSPTGTDDGTYQKTLDSVARIVGENGTVDLFLIHAPSVSKAAREELWLALERLYEAGKTRSIGVSNWGIGHIEEMKEYAKIWPPHVNQIELHPWCQQPEIDAYCQKHGIVVEAYSPLVRGHKANDPTLHAIARSHNKSPAQVLIRYSLQKNWVPLPKTGTPSRIIENADVYDFELTEGDMIQLNGLDQGRKGAIVYAVNNKL